jgi:hypothetical protein
MGDCARRSMRAAPGTSACLSTEVGAAWLSGAWIKAVGWWAVGLRCAPCSGVAPKDVLHAPHRYLPRLPHACSPFAAGQIADAACTIRLRAVLTCPFCDVCDPDISLVFKRSGRDQVSRQVLLQRCPALEYDSRSRQRRLSKLREHMAAKHGVGQAQVRWRSFPAPAHAPAAPPPLTPLPSPLSRKNGCLSSAQKAARSLTVLVIARLLHATCSWWVTTHSCALATTPATGCR